MAVHARRHCVCMFACVRAWVHACACVRACVNCVRARTRAHARARARARARGACVARGARGARVCAWRCACAHVCMPAALVFMLPVLLQAKTVLGSPGHARPPTHRLTNRPPTHRLSNRPPTHRLTNRPWRRSVLIARLCKRVCVLGGRIFLINEHTITNKVCVPRLHRLQTCPHQTSVSEICES